MPEPLRRRVRPTTMTRWKRVAGRLAVATCTGVLLSACGAAQVDDQGEPGNGGGDALSGSTSVGGCAADSAVVQDARTLTTADLDGDGAEEDVRITASGGECPNVLFAQVGDSFATGQIDTNAPPVSAAFAVSVPEVAADLLVTRQQHPRGGFQIRVFTLDEDTLVEVRDGDSPLVKFIATDVQEHPLSIDCTDGGLVLTEAVAHEPRGVMFAWDVRRTTYAVAPGAVSRESSEEIADNVLPAQLPRKFPQLVKYSMFESCRADG